MKPPTPTLPPPSLYGEACSLAGGGVGLPERCRPCRSGGDTEPAEPVLAVLIPIPPPPAPLPAPPPHSPMRPVPAPAPVDPPDSIPVEVPLRTLCLTGVSKPDCRTTAARSSAANCLCDFASAISLAVRPLAVLTPASTCAMSISWRASEAPLSAATCSAAHPFSLRYAGSIRCFLVESNALVVEADSLVALYCRMAAPGPASSAPGGSSRNLTTATLSSLAAM